jgi:hypothetical protein
MAARWDEMRWVNAGQSITCEIGHPIATAKEDIRPGYDDGWVPKMTWHQPIPETGRPARCRCGRSWMFTHTSAIRWLPDSMPIYKRQAWLCVEKEWSPSLTREAREYLDKELTVERAIALAGKDI